jgi:hypothetical protein
VLSLHCGKVLGLSDEVQHMYEMWTKSTQKSAFLKVLVMIHGSFDRFRLHFPEVPRVWRMQRCSSDAWLHSGPKKIEKRDGKPGDLAKTNFHSIQIFYPQKYRNFSCNV